MFGQLQETQELYGKHAVRASICGDARHLPRTAVLTSVHACSGCSAKSTARHSRVADEPQLPAHVHMPHASCPF